MRSLYSLAIKAVDGSYYKMALALGFALLLLPCVTQAQQPAASKKKVPRLTTDDVLRPKAVDPSGEQLTDPAAAKDGSSSKPEEEAKPNGPKSADPAGNPEEASWRERVQSARERAKSLERASEEAELRVTEIRNQMSVSGQTPQQRNQSAGELEQAGQRVTDLRAQARAAAEDLNKLVEYGREKGFKEAEGPKAASDDGKPNEQYYRSRFASLNEALQTADRRAQLYENRVRDLNQRITNNSVTGDNFYITQIQQERNEMQQKLEEARAARLKAQTDLDNLLEEARRNGVPPGVFR
jgi:chromosome segregation ATPase